MSFFLLLEWMVPHFFFCHMPIFLQKALTQLYKGFTGCAAKKKQSHYIDFQRCLPQHNHWHYGKFALDIQVSAV